MKFRIFPEQQPSRQELKSYPVAKFIWGIGDLLYYLSLLCAIVGPLAVIGGAFSKRNWSLLAPIPFVFLFFVVMFWCAVWIRDYISFRMRDFSRRLLTEANFNNLRQGLIVDLELIDTKNGGKTKSTSLDFMGFSALIGQRRDYYECRINFEGKSMSPGETRKGLKAYFMSPEVVSNLIKIGDTFTLWEGKAIGQATVVGIVVE